ncbi:MAG: nuclear transport factor 2 family protein [Gemmatimonadota bacterium]
MLHPSRPRLAVGALPVLAIALLTSLTAFDAPADSDPGNPDAEAIREVITSAYVEGLHMNGSRDAIRAGFHPDFVMKVLTDEGVTDVTIEEWIARLPAEGTSPPRTVGHEIPDVSVSGVAATARVEILFDGRLVFTDYMSLYRFGDEWRIVAKIFNREN